MSASRPWKQGRDFLRSSPVPLSRILIAASMLFYCVLPSFAGFLTANLLLGIPDAWESGAKDSYFLKQCLLQRLDYQKLKVRAAKYTYAVNFFLALVSTALFQASVYLPLLLTALFYIAATALFFSSAVLLLMPFSFLFLVSRSVPLILLGVCFQEIFFSYYNIHLNISVLNSIEDLQNSSYFQSMVSLINVVLRIVLTAVITLAFKVFPFGAVYGGFAAVTLCATCIYLRHTLAKDKS